MVNERATSEQVRFIVDRWPIFESLLTAADVDEKERFVAKLSRRRAAQLIARFWTVVRAGERDTYVRKGVRTCEACACRKACEMPSFQGRGLFCPAWRPDTKILPHSYEGFQKYVKGRLCRFKSPEGEVEGRPIEYVPGEAMLVRTEPDGRIETFLFGAGVMVEVLE